MAFRTFIKDNWRVLLTIVVSIGWGVFSFMRKESTTDETIKVINLVVGGILGLLLAEAVDIKKRFKDLRESNKLDLRNELLLIDRYSTRVVELLKNEDFRDLFGDLTNDLMIYNPHQYANRSTHLEEESIVKSMAERYRSRDFSSARFLVCMGDGYGQENLARFMIRLKKVYGTSKGKQAVKDKVRVGLLPREFLKEPTYHLQHKRKDRCLLELRMSGLVKDTAVPRFYLITDAPEIREHLRSQFDSAWHVATDIELASLFDEWDKAQDLTTAVNQWVRANSVTLVPAT